MSLRRLQMHLHHSRSLYVSPVVHLLHKSYISLSLSRLNSFACFHVAQRFPLRGHVPVSAYAWMATAQNNHDNTINKTGASHTHAHASNVHKNQRIK